MPIVCDMTNICAPTLQKDSWAIDYEATHNVLEAARAAGAAHFVLLSAICVQARNSYSPLIASAIH